MRRFSRVLALVVVLVAAAMPVFGDGCKVCNGFYDPEAGMVVLSCDPAVEGEMGFVGCNVYCSDGSCQCVQEGPPVYCMTIVVQG